MFKKIDLFIAIFLLLFSVLAPEYGLLTIPFLPIRFIVIVTGAIGILLLGRRLFFQGKNKNSTSLKFFGGLMIGLGCIMLWAYMGVLGYMFKTDSFDITDLSLLFI